MIKIKVPASSANIGPGFDCLGLALNIYNTFTVSLSDETILENIDDAYNNQDNLFLQAYRKGLEYLNIQDHIKVHFDCDVPISRGLGSSSTFIVGGLQAASVLHNHAIDQDTLFQLASSMEGHPDNIAPSIYGGLCASTLLDNGKYLCECLPFSDKWKLTAFIPNIEVSTQDARNVLPDVYTRDVAVSNACKSILVVRALESGNQELLNHAGNDAIHEPYRKELIPDFDKIKDLTEKDTNGKFLISGSGSTCILFHQNELSENTKKEIQSFDHEWMIKEVKASQNGVEIEECHE